MSVRIWIPLNGETDTSAHAKKLDSGNPLRGRIREMLTSHINNLRSENFNIPDDAGTTQFVSSLMPSRCEPHYGGVTQTPGGDMPMPPGFTRRYKMFKGIVILTFASLGQYQSFEFWCELCDDSTLDTTLSMLNFHNARWA